MVGERTVLKVYDRRLRIFVGFAALVLVVWVLRLVQMQLLSGSSVQDQIAELTRQSGQSKQLATLRGRILDRKSRVLATDEPRFYLQVSYELTSIYDERVRRAKLAEASKKSDAEASLAKIQEQLDARLADLQQIIEKCTRFGLSRDEIENRIRSINDRIWNLRTFVAWVRSGPDPNILEKHNNKVSSVSLSEAIADFEKRFPDETERLLRISQVNDIAEMSSTQPAKRKRQSKRPVNDTTEMRSTQPLLELKTADDVFAAQVEFMNEEDIHILPKAYRYYPYGSAAAQTIGWVGPATQERDKKVFADNKLASYLEGEVCGKEDGVEYVCENILRGRRGELVYDIDNQLIDQTETQFGQDVCLTLDIELQQKIEQYLTDSRRNPNYKAPTAAVVIDVASGEIIVQVSVPVFNLNAARYNYGSLASDPNNPLLNRVICQQYPPGSVVKPIILIAALESGLATVNEIIACPAQATPTGWPNCWIYRANKRGHSEIWPNNARNAIEGSCNIYFSHIADRLESVALQNWLFRFGYGRQLDLACPQANGSGAELRKFRQLQGQISSVPSPTAAGVFSFEQIPALNDGEKRLFGIGHGNLRATPLQVANAFAAIARGGIYKQPRLFLTNQPALPAGEPSAATSTPPTDNSTTNTDIDLKVSAQTMQVIYDGMAAVVRESGGTAYEAFAYSGFSDQGIRVYGKTGSTEKPEHAWFAGFVQDSNGRKLALAVIVEGGQHGAEDAAPLARDIIKFFIEAGHIGRTTSN